MQCSWVKGPSQVMSHKRRKSSLRWETAGSFLSQLSIHCFERRLMMQPVKLKNEVERPLPSHLGRVSLVVAIQWPHLAPTGPNTCFLKATPEVLKQLSLDPRDIDPSSLNDHSSQRIRVVKFQRDSRNTAFKNSKSSRGWCLNSKHIESHLSVAFFLCTETLEDLDVSKMGDSYSWFRLRAMSLIYPLHWLNLN